MSFESYAGDSAEDYPLTAGTFDPFSFDDLLGQAYENNSSEVDAHWGTLQPPQVAVSGNYHVGGEGVGSSTTIRNPTTINRGTSSPVILQEQVVPSTNFASR